MKDAGKLCVMKARSCVESNRIAVMDCASTRWNELLVVIQSDIEQSTREVIWEVLSKS